MRILLTNDDGIEARGLRTLFKSLRAAGHEVYAVAPERETSACGHGISLHAPLRLKKRGVRIYSVDGTPTDCVNLAVFEVMKAKPDLVLAGINQGPNLGTDTLYSGTVAGAIEGALLGINAAAISLASFECPDFKASAEFTSILCKLIKKHGLPPDVCLNVNIPPTVKSPDFKVRMTTLGKRRYSKVIKEGVDPRGKKYYWIGGEPVEMDKRECCDTAVVKAGLISITPIKLDITAVECMGEMKSWFGGRFE